MKNKPRWTTSQKRFGFFVAFILFGVMGFLAMCAIPASGTATDCKNAETKINVIVATGLHWDGTLNADDGDGCYYTFKVDELGMIQSATATYGDTVIYHTGQ